jgi:tetratricopeptide (TPR) repeat protein
LDTAGVALAQTGKLGEALEQFRLALQLAPDFVDAHYHKALAHDGLGQTDEAMSSLQEALLLRNDFLPPRYLLAACCRKRGDFEGEIRLLADIVRRSPDFAEARYNYGLALQRGEKPAEAVEQLRAAVRLQPKVERFALALGVALADREADEAVRTLKLAVDLAPQDADTHYNLALAMAAAGDDTGAIAEFNSAIQFKATHANAYRGLGIALLHADRLDESVRALRRAVDLAPRDAEAANNLGVVLLRLNDIDGAIQTLTEAVRLNPKLIKAHVSLAQAYQRARRTDAARTETQRVAELTAEQRSFGRAMVLTQSARQHLKANRTAEAISALREAIALRPEFVDGHFELGRALLETGADPREATGEFRRVLNLDPARADAHFNMGLAFLKLGERSRGLDELRTAVSMAPCRTETMRALARAALDGGDRVTAQAMFRRALAWDAGDAEARAGLEQALKGQGSTR